MMVHKSKLLSILALSLCLTGCLGPDNSEPKDSNPEVQSSYDSIKKEINRDRESIYPDNPYDYISEFNADTEELFLKIRQHHRDRGHIRWITPAHEIEESGTSLRSTQLAKQAQLNGQIFTARYFKRPIRVEQELGLLLGIHSWIYIKPSSTKNYSLSEIPLNPEQVSVHTEENRVFLSYFVKSHLSPSLQRPIATSKYFWTKAGAQSELNNFNTTIENAKKEKIPLRARYDESNKLIVELVTP